MKFFTLMLISSALVSCRQGGELANESLNGGKITNGTVSEVKIADNSVTETKIADASVTPAKLDRSYQESLPVSGSAGDYLNGSLAWTDFATSARASVSAQLLPVVTPISYDPGTGVFALTTVTPDFGGTGLTALGAANQVLGVVGAGGTAEYKSIVGTPDQVIVNHIGSDITLSAPQDIASTSSPSFVGVSLSGALSAASASLAGALSAAGATLSNLLSVNLEDAATNSATTVARLTHTTSDPAFATAGFGTTFEFSAEQDSGVVVAQGQITSSWTSAAAGAESSQLAFSTLNMGVPTQALVLSPEGSATVAGGITIGGGIATTVLRTSAINITVDNSHSVVLLNPPVASPVLVTLPAPAVGNRGRQYTFKKIDANLDSPVTFSEDIDGDPAYDLAVQYDYVVIVSDGFQWLKVGGN